MEGWRATVLCRLDCAIKMGLRVVAIKVSRHTAKGFSCRAIVGGSWSEVRGLSFFDDG